VHLENGRDLVINAPNNSRNVYVQALKVNGKGRAVQYTLTSADRAKAPTGWVLEGSPDGEKWQTLDRRSDESWSWDKQTRVFTVRTPGTYEHYRLVPDGKTTLAEVELLG
jgi:hypothetical protein